LLDENRILEAEGSLKRMLEVQDLKGTSFLDIGCGSGLFSLAARRLGARVHAFDYDPASVACTAELRRRYYPADDQWTIQEGSVLDAQYMKSLGTFDIVYSWGVLHHTGRMWEALENALAPVALNGALFIAIYNDMGSQSVRWRWIKRSYNRLPALLRPPFTFFVMAPGEAKSLVRCLLSLQFGEYLRSWTQYSRRRGMSHWRDIVDWVGGYPYEVASPDEVFEFCRKRGLTLVKLRCRGVGLGCNEFVFTRDRSPDISIMERRARSHESSGNQ
jgi:2-polyprenyl-6-hydroxyphenyl methylase/3-demethylubiquinone-9 3-methyltransferase